MNKKNKSQKDVVLDTLTQTGHITSLEAFTMFGITRLSAIIFKLREEGYKIDSVPKQTKNRYGNNCQYVEYRRAWL